MDGKIEKSAIGFTGNHSALTPNNTANLWLKYQINDHWYAAVGGRGESSRFSAPDNKNVLPICSCKCGVRVIKVNVMM